MSYDLNNIRTRLENELLQRIGLHPNNAVQHNTERLTGITSNDGGNSLSKLNSKQSLTSALEDKEIILLHLLGEFTKKDEGKVLASELNKFARYVQSEAAKANA